MKKKEPEIIPLITITAFVNSEEPGVLRTSGIYLREETEQLEIPIETMEMALNTLHDIFHEIAATVAAQYKGSKAELAAMKTSGTEH